MATRRRRAPAGKPASRTPARRTDRAARLRESEARFRRLTELSSDWFWEQDEQYRFTRLEGRNVRGGDPAAREQVLGTRCWDGALQVEGGWPAYRARLEAREPFHDVLMWRRTPAGDMRYVRISGEPVFDAAGRFAGYRGVGRDVTAQMNAEESLRESEARFRSLTALSSDWFWEQDEQYRFTRLEGRNVAGGDQALRERLLGRRRWESDLQVQGGWEAHRALLEARRPFLDVLMWRRMDDGSLRYMAVSGEPIRTPDGRFMGYRGVGRDISAVKRVEEALRESEARFRALAEMSSDFYWETDAHHRLTDMTYGRGAIGRMDEALGKAAWEVPSTHPDAAGWAQLRAKVDAHEPFRDFEFARVRRDGSARYFSVSGEPRFGPDGAFMGYRGVGRETTDAVRAREHIASLAFQDPLTGLANRTSLAPTLEQAVERTRRRGNKLAGLFLDLDGFKQINDLHGHDAGDRLLVETAQRLRAALRVADPVARLGGDEFFVVLEDLHTHAPAERVAQKLLDVLREAFDLGEGRRASISASIGISVFPDDARDAATLMKHADRAMYAAKEAGKNAYRFFAGED